MCSNVFRNRTSWYSGLLVKGRMALELFEMLVKNASVWFKGGLKFISNNCNFAYEHKLDSFKNFEMCTVFQKCFNIIRCQSEHSIYGHFKNVSDCLINYSLLFLCQTSSCEKSPTVTSRLFSSLHRLWRWYSVFENVGT